MTDVREEKGKERKEDRWKATLWDFISLTLGKTMSVTAMMLSEESMIC